jgi:hypothetical protein
MTMMTTMMLIMTKKQVHKKRELSVNLQGGPLVV